MRLGVWVHLAGILLIGMSLAQEELPRAIALLEDFQRSFVEKEKEAQVLKIKEAINGNPNSPVPMRSPAKILQDGEALHKTNHMASAVEWFLVYTGQDITPALLIFFSICPLFCGYFVRKYIYRLLKPKLIMKRKSNFPIIPLKYLQETKDEQRVFLPSKNTLRWASTRYIIMASDNVVNLKMLHYGQESEESQQVKYRKHRAWFILRILAKFNAIYTRNKLEKNRLRLAQEEIAADPKMAQLVKIRRLQAHQEEMKRIAELEAEKIQRDELGGDDEEEEGHLYKFAADKSGLRQYTYDLRHPADRVSMDFMGKRIRKPGATKTRTSLEVMYEGLRRGMSTPNARLSLEYLRKMSQDSLQGEPGPQFETGAAKKKNLKAAAMGHKKLMRGLGQEATGLGGTTNRPIISKFTAPPVITPEEDESVDDNEPKITRERIESRYMSWKNKAHHFQEGNARHHGRHHSHEHERRHTNTHHRERHGHHEKVKEVRDRHGTTKRAHDRQKASKDPPAPHHGHVREVKPKSPAPGGRQQELTSTDPPRRDAVRPRRNNPPGPDRRRSDTRARQRPEVAEEPQEDQRPEPVIRDRDRNKQAIRKPNKKPAP